MSHEIDFSLGRAAVFTTGKPAWHGLGTTVAEAQTAEQAIELAGQNWSVGMYPLTTWTEDRASIDCDDYRAIVREDIGRVLGVVGPGYTPFQNRHVFEFLDSLTAEGMKYESAGALKGGKRVWMLARMPGEARVGRDDVSYPYALASTGHDGCNAIKILPTATRVVCWNTLTAAIATGRERTLNIRHTANAKERLGQARKTLGLIQEEFAKHGQAMQALAARKLNSAESSAYFQELFPTRTESRAQALHEVRHAMGAGLLDSILDQQTGHAEIVSELLAGHFARTEAEANRNRGILQQIMENYESERNNLPGIEHSAWSALNAVTEYVDHDRKSRGRNDQERAENRLQSNWFGSGAQLKNQAYQAALQLVN